MMGIVDSSGRALIEVTLRSTTISESAIVSVWIDTGFTGDLVLPSGTIRTLALPLSGTVAGNARRWYSSRNENIFVRNAVVQHLATV